MYSKEPRCIRTISLALGHQQVGVALNVQQLFGAETNQTFCRTLARFLDDELIIERAGGTFSMILYFQVGPSHAECYSSADLSRRAATSVEWPAFARSLLPLT
jgi:hypothetical protein